MIKLTVNGEARSLDVDPDMPLQWALRDEPCLTGQDSYRLRPGLWPDSCYD